MNATAAQSRTWTSADGERTFEASFVQLSGQEVTVNKGGIIRRFNISILSKADQKWVTKHAVGKFTKQLSGNISKISNGNYSPSKLTKNPDFYVVYFTANWWGPCRRAVPQLVKTYNNKISTTSNVELIQVSLDKNLSAAKNWATKEKFPWHTVLHNKIGASKLDRFKVKAVPTYLLLDKAGKKIASGKNNVFQKVKELSTHNATEE